MGKFGRRNFAALQNLGIRKKDDIIDDDPKYNSADITIVPIVMPA